MKEILVGIDRDDTINFNPGGDFGRQENWKDLLEIYPTVIPGIKLLNSYRCTLTVASKQSGVARGLFPYERQEEVNQALDKRLGDQGAWIDSWNFCPYYNRTQAKERGIDYRDNPWILQDQDPRTRCRKPGIGLLEEGVSKFGRTLGYYDHIAFIGDQMTDVWTGLNAGGIGILIGNGRQNYEQVLKLDKKDSRQIYATDFYDAAHIILSTFL